MSAAVTTVTAAPGVLALAGELTFATAARALAEARGKLGADVATLDLGSLARADSAGLAVVIALVREVRSRGRTLAIVGMPAGLAALAQLCEVDELIGPPAG